MYADTSCMKQYLDMLIDPTGVALRKIVDEMAQARHIESLAEHTFIPEGGEYQALLDEVIADFTRGYGPALDSGADRTAFDGGDIVYKVGWPTSQMREVEAFENPASYGDLPVAPCRLVWHANGIPIVIMLTVRPATPDDDLPEWSTRIDHQQIGWRDGAWMVYDAGGPIDDIGSHGDCWLDPPMPAMFRQEQAA